MCCWFVLCVLRTRLHCCWGGDVFCLSFVWFATFLHLFARFLAITFFVRVLLLLSYISIFELTESYVSIFALYSQQILLNVTPLLYIITFIFQYWRVKLIYWAVFLLIWLLLRIPSVCVCIMPTLSTLCPILGFFFIQPSKIDTFRNLSQLIKFQILLISPLDFPFPLAFLLPFPLPLCFPKPPNNFQILPKQPASSLNKQANPAYITITQIPIIIKIIKQERHENNVLNRH